MKKSNPSMNASEKSSPLRRVALVGLVVGAIGCEYFMFRVGRQNPSVVLRAMFAAWVLAPFAGLAWCHRAAKRWPDTLRVVLHGASLLVVIVSLAVYSYVAFGPPRSQPAFFFLVLPFGSLVLIAALVVGARKWKKSNL